MEMSDHDVLMKKRRSDLSTFLVDLIDCLDGVQVVNTGVETDFIQNHDSGGLGFLVEGTHGRGYVAGGHNVCLSLNRGLDDGSVEDVRNKGNDEVMFGNSGVQSSGIVDIDRHSSGIGKVGCECFSTCKSAAG